MCPSDSGRWRTRLASATGEVLTRISSFGMQQLASLREIEMGHLPQPWGQRWRSRLPTGPGQTVEYRGHSVARSGRSREPTGSGA
jgi:hypothetical protein